jgi:hypothetical protein
MKTPIILTFFMALLAAGATNVQAQADSLEMDVTFTGTKELYLKNATKLTSWPQIKESIVEIPSIRYTLIPNKQQVDIQTKPIQPARINVEERISRLYQGYIKGGFGVYTTPLIDLYYMDERNRNGVWSVHYNHLSSAGGVALEDSIPDEFSNNNIQLWGRKYLKKHALEGMFEWDRDVVHYYGFDPQLYWDTDTDDLMQRFNAVAGQVHLTSYFRDSSKVNYNGGVAFRNYRDLEEGVENNVHVTAHARKIMGSELYNVDIDANYNDFTYFVLGQDDVEENYSNFLLKVAPTVETRVGNFKVNVGAGIWIDARGERPFHFYPLAEASYSILDDLFIPYAGVRGQMELNTYHSVTQDNPFVVTDIALRNTNRRLELYGGIRGTLSSTTSFNAQVSQTNYEDFLYFVNDSASGPGNQFVALYDGLNVFNLRGEVSIHASEALNLFIRGDYFLYGTDAEAEPWYQPTTRLTFTGSYDLQDRLVVNLDIFTEGKRKAKSLVQTREGEIQADGSYVDELRGYADANLGIEYRYTKRLSAWVRLNNLLASRYQRWNLYNVQRFNAMMGVTYAF